MASSDLDNITIGSTVAMLDSNQGIGYKGQLPWPYLKEDVNHYMSICTETSDPNKKNGVVLGKISWMELLKKKGVDNLHPKLSYVVTSTTMPRQSEGCRAVKNSYHEAIEELYKGVKEGELEKIFVLGGRHNYEMAIDDPRLKSLHVTRIFMDYPVDQYFPEFGHNFHKVSTSGLKEDNGIRYQFEVWNRNSS